MIGLLIAISCAWLSGFFTLAAYAVESSSAQRDVYTTDGIRLIGTGAEPRISIRKIFIGAAVLFGFIACAFTAGAMHAMRFIY